MSRAVRTRSPLATDLALEVALVALSLATVGGFARLFDDGVFFWRIAGPVIVAHLLAAACRRLGLGILLSGLVSLAGMVVVIPAVLYRDTLSMGLASGQTREAIRIDLEAAWQLFDEVGPPAPVLPGFVLVAAVVMWIAAFLADWAAFRLRSPLEAILPSGAVFLFCTVYTKTHHREVAAGLFLAGVLLVLLTHRARSTTASPTWMGSRARAAGATLASGTVLGAVAVAAALGVGPDIPGATDGAIVEWREIDGGRDARVTVSPLVDIRATLVNQRDVEVFTVRAQEPDYWRLTSLDRFNGLVWESSGSFDDASGALPSDLPADLPRRPLVQEISVTALDDLWLPAAYEPARVVDGGGTEPVYEPASGTLVVGSEVGSADGFTYTIESRIPQHDPALIAAAGDEIPGQIADRYLDLPPDFDDDDHPVVRAASEATAGATTPYERALALQDWFRANFTYDLDVAAGHSVGSIEEFLELRRGYCEQFAGAYAAMARTLGIPARVAVGFTPGDRDGDVFRVRGEHAHAWPEVWMQGVGWLRFEPTPGRGAPGDVVYTGVEPAQAAAGDETSSETVATSSIPVPEGPDFGDVPLAPPEPGPSSGTGGGGGGGDGDGRDATALLVGVAIALGILALVPAAKIARRRLAWRRAADARDRVRLSWVDTLEQLATVGLDREPAETPLEHARRVGPQLERGDALADLAELVTRSGFSPVPPDAADESAAQAAARVLRREVRERRGWLQTLGALVDPRPLFRRSATSPRVRGSSGERQQPPRAA